MGRVGAITAICLLSGFTFVSTVLLAQHDSTWYGFSQYEFDVQGHKSRVVVPKHEHPEKFWIWRARFWGHEPQVDTSLLHAGFHVVWIDVADLYGSPAAVEIGNRFYQHLRSNYGLHAQAVLEGFSRGGLFVYHWALANPTKVACIYADAPVLDIHSWPGGKGAAQGSPPDWEKCLTAYGLSDESAVDEWYGPMQRAVEIAEHGLPLLHVCGRSDSIVPYAENTLRLQKELRANGHDLQVILKEGIGHHPHSLKDPSAVVRFILQHTDPALVQALELTEIKPSIIYRNRWLNRGLLHSKDDSLTIAFLGGSITYGAGWRDSLEQYFTRKMSSRSIRFINAGIPSMGSVPGAFRLSKDVLAAGPIDILFVEAAVNDATNGRSSVAQVRGMEGIVRQVLGSHPTNIIMMHFVDPDKMADYNQGKTPEVIIQHEKVAEHYDITSLNLAKEVNDRILQGEFTWDDDFKDLHPSPFGHGIYSRTMIECLDSLFSRKDPTWQQIPPSLDPFSYDKAKWVSIDQAQIKSGWQYVPNWDPADSLRTRPGFVHVPALTADSPGAELQFNFTGQAIGILVAAGADVGQLLFQIDDGSWQELEQFTQWSHWLHLPWLYVLADELTAGSHILRMKISPKKHPLSKGHASRILAFGVNE